MEQLNEILTEVSGLLWGWPMIILLLGTHVYLTIILRFPQRRIRTAILLSIKRDAGATCDVSQFGSLATALAATIGTGNIIGVATAIALGGPGAVLWCWLTGVFGISTKYAEGLLAIKYRVKTEKGRMLGGPMYALERGLGWKWLAVLFALFTALASFGIGNTVQANAIATVANETYDISPALTGAVVCLLTGAVVLGGVKSIARVCGLLVPFMALFYVMGCLYILCVNAPYLWPALKLIVHSAFSPQAAGGGFIGTTVMMAARYGIARGLFSNESGMGSAPIVAAAAQTRNPVRQALVSSSGTFWDTVVICALTGLVIVSSVLAYPDIDFSNGATLTKAAFSKIPFVGTHLLTFGLLTFAFSTILGWCYYGERAVEYLRGRRWVTVYRVVYIAAVFAGSIMNLTIVWNLADCMNALMAIPNLVSLLALSGILVHETRKYLWRGRLDKTMIIGGMMILGTASAQAANGLDSIRHILEEAPVQEKVYLHLDNNCYYRGEEIWYKAYVVRADDNNYTDLSRLLYVELVSPDGLLVERQTIRISEDGDGEGSFYLTDSLYSGFYEIRAYTRWMMNFCVTEHPSNYNSRRLFYSKQMASDFYRLYGTVYSRVVPVYETPEQLGDYARKYIVERPKQRLDKELKANLKVSFYPEGGHLIAGTKARVAFEAVNELGEQVDISGQVRGKTIRTEHEGRGVFTIDVPADGRLEAHFRYADKDYEIDLPKTEKTGCALSVKADGKSIKADIALRGVPTDADYAAIVLSRGQLKAFERFRPDGRGQATVGIGTGELPSGVSDLIIIDNDGRPMADRLFFVNHHDCTDGHIKMTTKKTDYQPYEAIDLELQVPEGADQISVSVRDAGTDDATYDTGNIMTELLLSSELKGFIPHPDYYFEADDQQHRHHLDLLLMVQGWRRYNYEELTSNKPLRYGPEQGITVEGNVFETVPADWEIDEIKYWQQGVFGYSETKALHADPNDPTYKELRERIDGVKSENEKLATLDGTMELENIGQSIFIEEPAYLQQTSASARNEEKKLAVEHGPLKHEVTVECELVELDENGEQLEGSQITTQKAETTNGGHFHFELPDFKLAGALFLRAYKTSDNEKKLRKKLNKGFLSEEAFPDYFVKRNLFFPVFAKKYSYYQCHLPDDDNTFQTFTDDQVKAVDSLSKMDRVLSEVTVKKRRRRGRRRIDYSKPVCVYDTHELYNLCTDLGLCYGQFDMMNFPVAVATALFGTYNKDRFFNVQARFKDEDMSPYVFYRNFALHTQPFNPSYSSSKVAGWFRLGRQDVIKCYTDFELRNEDRNVPMSTGIADVTLQFELLPGDGQRPVWRDRRILMPGIIEPDEFYLKPDYSRRPPREDSYDYRRTLYWDPAATPDDDGRLRLHLFNNGKQTRICVSAAGIGEEGELLYMSENAK